MVDRVEFGIPTVTQGLKIRHLLVLAVFIPSYSTICALQNTFTLSKYLFLTRYTCFIMTIMTSEKIE